MQIRQTNIFNINRLLKFIKSNTIANFLQLDNKSIIVTLNQVASLSDINIIDRYIRGTDDINSSDIAPTHFPQSKSYLKILGIPYITNSTSPIIYNQIEEIIKVTQLFNNITLVFQPCIIKASLKSDMAVIWIDIWDSQNSTKAKRLINKSFNVGQYIATI